MINIRELHLKNFGIFRELDLTDLRGLVLCTGDNGTGKSTIPIAIAWALFGKTPKKINLGDFINWDVKKNCVVEVTLDVDNEQLKVTRTRKPDNLTVEYGGKSAPLHKDEAQNMIESILNADFKSFINATMFTKGEVTYIGAATPAERMEIFKRLLDLEEFDEARKRAGKEEAIATDKSIRAETIAVSLTASIQLKETEVKVGKEAAKKFEIARTAQLTGLAEEKKKLESEIRRLSSERPKEVKEVTQELVDNMYAQERDMVTACSLVEQAINTADARINSIPEGKCPTCEQDITSGYKAGLTKPLIDQRNAQQHELTKTATKLKTLQSKLQLIRTARDNYVAYQETLRRNHAASLEVASQLTVIDSSINAIVKKVQPEEVHTKKLEQEISELRAKQTASQQEGQKHKINATILSVCKDMFKQLQLQYVKQKFEYLNYKANEILSKLPCRDIKTGRTYTLGVNLLEEKDAIEIDAIIKGMENKKYEQASSGEKLRIDLSFIFALNALCRYRGKSRLGFLCFDEVLDLSLDPLGESSLLEILQQLAGDIPWILVISHKPEYRNHFPIHWPIDEIGRR